MKESSSYKLEKSSRAVKKLPSSENGRGVRYISKVKQEYCISQNLEKKKFTLWKVTKCGYEKIATCAVEGRVTEIAIMSQDKGRNPGHSIPISHELCDVTNLIGRDIPLKAFQGTAFPLHMGFSTAQVEIL